MKKLNLLFLVLLFPCLTSCYQPSTNDLPEIPFRQPLILEPNKAQDFYFDITKEETSVYKEYEIGVEIIFPEQMPYEKFNPIHDRIREKGLPFNISLWRVENGKDIPFDYADFTHREEKGYYHVRVIPLIKQSDFGETQVYLCIDQKPESK